MHRVTLDRRSEHPVSVLANGFVSRRLENPARRRHWMLAVCQVCGIIIQDLYDIPVANTYPIAVTIMANNVPFVPQLTGRVLVDLELITQYLYTLNRYLAEGDPNDGWSTSGTLTAKSVVSGMTLLALTDVVATLIQVLQEKGVLSS